MTARHYNSKGAVVTRNILVVIKTLELCSRPAQQEESIFGAGDLANYSRLVMAFGGEPT